MKKILLILLVLAITVPCYGAEFNTTTGYGYFTKPNGTIHSKTIVRTGTHKTGKQYTFNEVANQAELDAIEIFVPSPTIAQQRKKKIRRRMRKMAIGQLITDGELPANYEE